MSKSRMPLVLGLGAAGGIGYYLYSAGGSPKVAEKQFESDAHKMAAKIKGEVPHRSGVDAEKQGKQAGQEVGKKVDDAVATVNKDLSKAKSEAEAYAKGAKAETIKKIDEMDRKVEEQAAKAKSWTSSWFGGK
ncbi:hypothetical protein QBC46DRAFT_340742 [Diplogelasinospora grovesii]|uniref:Calcofluor white hypersensitive protein n=1 Tax=Diplogelasinospora grovesii TaxID=303347 RepID=A0AAN6NBK3_9PEZI|nr:hypothetical protein QBC46DRAFT_340742 [Diplogelasinospora grovesii]